MVKGRRKKRKASNSPKFLKSSVRHLLEIGTLEGMQHAKRATDEHLKFQWDYYAELARQRSAISDSISAVLTQAARPLPINNWQRAVKYKYGLHPFCTMGSLVYIGSRFNTGLKVNAEVPSFPALYLAQDKDTALQEHLGQRVIMNGSDLMPREAALTDPSSETIVSVSGQLDKVFDLTNPKNLEVLIDLLQDFKISKELIERAKKLGIQQPGTVKTVKALLDTLLHPDWRQIPSNCDVPSNSQIFGHLIYTAKIEGILYPSKFTKKLCVAVFPRNFVGTDSFLKLDDDVPHVKVPARIDATSWRICEIDAKEIIGA